MRNRIQGTAIAVLIATGLSAQAPWQGNIVTQQIITNAAATEAKVGIRNTDP